MTIERNLSELLSLYNEYARSKVTKVRILGDSDERDLKDVFVELNVVEPSEKTPHPEFFGMVDSAMRRRLNPFVYQRGNEDVTRGEKRSTRRVRPLELLRPRIRAIISGSPGAGKSTLLKYLALRTLDSGERFTVWLELKALHRELLKLAEKSVGKTGGLLLRELWLKHLESHLTLTVGEVDLLRHHWVERFRSNQLLILLDGFDEIHEEGAQETLNKCVNESASALSDNTILISTRPYAKHKLGTEGFEEFEISPLDQPQIAAFLNCYYPGDPQNKVFLKEVQDRKALRELLYVPLLLGVILRLYKNRELTSDKLSVYNTIIRTLVRDVDRSKSVTRKFKIPDERLRLDFLKFVAFEQLLRHVPARDKHAVNRIVFDYDLLLQDATTFLAIEHSTLRPRDLADDALATPLLREVASDLFAFTHLTLQEFLAASAFARFLDRNEVDGFTQFCLAYHNPLVVEMEALPMTLALCDSASNLYLEIERWPESPTFVNLRLRARGLAYGATVSEEILSSLCERLAKILVNSTNEEEPYRRIILRSLVGVEGKARDVIEDHIIPSLNRHSGFEDQKAAEALAVIGSERSFEPLLRALDPQAVQRGFVQLSIGRFDDQRINYICRALTRINPPKAVPILASISTIYSYGEIDRLLKDIGTEEAYRALLFRKGKTMDWLSSNAAQKLSAESKTTSVIEALRQALRHSNANVRGLAVETLGNIGLPDYVDDIVRCLFDADFSVRWKAAHALRSIGSDKAVPGLLQALRDGESTVRWSAAMALETIGSADAVDGLISALADPDPEVQYWAASTLGNLSDSRAVEPLLIVLEHGGSKARRPLRMRSRAYGTPKRSIL